ncbi:MAG: hypothetical protein D6731_13840 [Planctomycetota bacterium]|nr:MAG: hypothetical protein D6731_13840 [Planctomycetota bacterium]
MLLRRGALGLWALLLVGGGRAAAQEADPYAEVRGVTVSCQTWGQEWGSDAMAAALGEVRALGANWVAIHPYARVWADGQVTPLRGALRPPPRWLTRPIAEAHARGLKVLIKPHLAYWGSPFRWRGEIAFAAPTAWERFWRDYERWLLSLVDACRGADGFVVGTELDRTLTHEARWRRLIAAVRERTRAPLTYAANWTDVERVGFWDALDVIGVQAYFPLVEHVGAPSDEELAQGWARVLARLTRLARRHRRRVLLTELGYDQSPEAARRPWASGRGRYARDPAAAALQERCLRAGLRAVANCPDVVGALLWKWFPGPAPGEDFRLQRPGLRAVVRSAWGARRRGP